MNDASVSQGLLTETACRPYLSFVTETYPPEINGVARTVGEMVAGALARNIDVQLIRPWQRGEPQESNHKPGETLETVRIRGFSLPWYPDVRLGLPSSALLRTLWSRRRPDWVHIATEGPIGWSALSVANVMGIPVTTAFHTNFHTYAADYGLGFLYGPAFAYLRAFHNRAHCTLVPTKELSDSLRKLGITNTRVLPRGIDTHTFSPKHRSDGLRRSWGAAESTRVVLYVGRIAREKNLPSMIACFRKMQGGHPDTRLVLVGDGPLREELQGCNPDVVFCGSQTGHALAAHYASADMFLFASLTETFGNVTLEAMASGLAVVAFDYGAAREYIKDGYNGVLAPFGDMQRFTEVAISLIEQPGQLRWIGGNARFTVEPLGFDHMHTAFIRILHECTEESKSHA